VPPPDQRTATLLLLSELMGFQPPIEAITRARIVEYQADQRVRAGWLHAVTSVH